MALKFSPMYDAWPLRIRSSSRFSLSLAAAAPSPILPLSSSKSRTPLLGSWTARRLYASSALLLVPRSTEERPLPLASALAPTSVARSGTDAIQNTHPYC